MTSLLASYLGGKGWGGVFFVLWGLREGGRGLMGDGEGDGCDGPFREWYCAP